MLLRRQQREYKQEQQRAYDKDEQQQQVGGAYDTDHMSTHHLQHHITTTPNSPAASIVSHISGSVCQQLLQLRYVLLCVGQTMEQKGEHISVLVRRYDNAQEKADQ